MSSPITQWSQTVRHELVLQHMSGEEGYKQDPAVNQTLEAITSATIELALALIGEDELLPTSLFDWEDDDQRKYWYNKFRAELRQSLKELSNDIER